MKIIKKILINEKQKLSDAMKLINKSGNQIVLVVNSSKHLLGTITDGDVRRALLKNRSLSSNVKSIMNSNYKFLYNGTSPSQILSSMNEHRVKHMPILSRKKKLVDFYSITDFLKEDKLNAQIVIMAGGKGKRLGLLTKKCPKPMLKINGKPILEILVNMLKMEGFYEFLISVNYLKSHIKKYFENGSKFGVNINYLEEKKPMGTAGSLSLINKKINKPIIIINGDVLTHISFKKLYDFHIKSKSLMTVCVQKKTTNLPYGKVSIYKNTIKKLEEKPELKYYINAGIYVVDPFLLKYVRKKKIDMDELINLLIKIKIKPKIFLLNEYWKDIGDKENLFQSYKDWIY
jgi:dTDP-glucose pyrophosphorylase